MTQNTNTNDQEFTSQEREFIDSICDEFEHACKSGARPTLEDYVKRFQEPLLTEGLVELVILDAFYNQSVAEDPAFQNTFIPTKTSRIGARDADPPSAHSSSESLWQDYTRRFPRLAGAEIPSEFRLAPQVRHSISDRFHNVQAFASGGLGKVSVANDLQFNRTVAVKEMHDRLSHNEGYRQRFLREAEITGQLEHPGIVPVYVKGHHPGGEPYYVMRLIQGRSLLEAIGNCKDDTSTGGLSLDRRKLLNRFVDVCRTMEYAHSRSVIHRDIKPDNIMLGDYGETLLVDWGLAKKMQDDDLPLSAANLDEITSDPTDSSQTNMGTVMGTPPYMSPEQFAGDLEKVNQSTDIYSLGATLFQILTGEIPKQSNRQNGLLKINFGDHLVPKPFQAICRHAMSPEPEQRYATADELASDVELALADQPISVYPDPVTTRVRRWIEHHLALTAATLVAAGLVLVGAIAFSWISGNYASELLSKNLQLDQMVDSEQKLRESAEQSEKRTREAMKYLVDAIRSPDPFRDGREIKVVDILEQAIEQLETDFADDPLLKAQMLSAFGRTYLGLGKFAEAKPLVKAAREIYLSELGEHDRLTLASGDLLAEVYYMHNDPAAKTLISSVVESSRRQFGNTDPDTLSFRFTAAEQLRISGDVRQAVTEFELILTDHQNLYGPDSEATLNVMNTLAVAYKDSGLAKDAVRMSKLVYENRMSKFGPDSAKTIISGSNYAVHLGDTTNRNLAAPLHEKFLEAAREKWGNEHHRTLVYINRLATNLVNENDLDRAIPLLLELFETSREVYGLTETVTLNAANTLAIAYLNAGEYENAVRRFKELYELSVKVNGLDHKRTLTIANNLGAAYRNTKNYDGSIDLLRSALVAQKENLGPEHPDSLRTMLNLASTLQLAGRFDESIPVCREAHQVATSHYGADYGHAQTAQSLEAMAHMKLKDYQSAKKVLQAAHQSRARTIPDHWLRYNTMSLLGEAHLGLGELAEAEPMLLESYQNMLEQKEKIPPRAQNRIDQARDRLVRLYESKNQPDEAEKFRQ